MKKQINNAGLCPGKTWICPDLQMMDYMQALRLQESLVSARADGKLKQDVLLFVEHFPVFTLGNRGGVEYLHVTRDFLKQKGVALVETGRGGSITYHGPGQLVAYPIVDLASAGWQVTEFVDALEKVMISIAGHWGLDAAGDKSARGAWVEGRKIGSIGLRVRRKVSFHGLALNVSNDLSPFDWITPCGLSGIEMTSIEKETGLAVSVQEAACIAGKQFEKVFGVRLESAPELSPALEHCYV